MIRSVLVLIGVMIGFSWSGLAQDEAILDSISNYYDSSETIDQKISVQMLQGLKGEKIAHEQVGRFYKNNSWVYFHLGHVENIEYQSKLYVIDNQSKVIYVRTTTAAQNPCDIAVIKDMFDLKSVEEKSKVLILFFKLKDGAISDYESLKLIVSKKNYAIQSQEYLMKQQHYFETSKGKVLDKSRLRMVFSSRGLQAKPQLSDFIKESAEGVDFISKYQTYQIFR